MASLRTIAEPARSRPGGLLSPRLVDRLQGYLFLSPALVGLTVFVLGPMLYAFGLSFVRWDLIRPNPRFVGLDNDATVLTSPERAGAAGGEPVGAGCRLPVSRGTSPDGQAGRDNAGRR